MNKTIIIKNVDMEMLAQQKELLLELVWDLPVDHMLWGLVYLIDAMQDNGSNQ